VVKVMVLFSFFHDLGFDIGKHVDVLISLLILDSRVVHMLNLYHCSCTLDSSVVNMLMFFSLFPLLGIREWSSC